MNTRLKAVLVVAGLTIATQVAAQVVFYEHDDFAGRAFSAEDRVGDFARYGFNDLASSVDVIRDRWEVCEDARFNGRCVVLRPGRYRSFSAMGLNDRISSARIVERGARFEESRYAPPPPPPAPPPEGAYDYRRGDDERLYEAEVISSRAVVSAAEERCWIERKHVAPDRRPANVPAAIAGAVVGGILGHQLGNGRGQDLATAGGAVAGAALGANLGRDSDGGQGYSQDVRRCAAVPEQTRPEYWDVTYRFRGQEHRMQMTVPPGRTVTVNRRGEPRG